MFPWNLTIAANETMPVSASGSFVYVDAAEGKIRLEAYNEGTRVAEVPLSFAREANLPFFTKLYVTDTSGAENTVRLLVGGENEGYERNGSEITGPVGPGGGVLVEDPDGGGESFAEVIAKQNDLLALLKNAFDQRGAITDLSAASYGDVSGSGTTLVTAGENTNGVIIRWAGACAVGPSGTASISAGGQTLAFCKSGNSGSDWGNAAPSDTIKDVKVPAGVSIDISASTSQMRSFCWYEVL